MMCRISLRERRIGQALTQKQLSEKSGVNLRMVQKYENGEKDINKAQAITLHLLAQALDCTIEDLLEL
jgi:transcriptional regulator with XRE-family HTH domain